MVAIGKWLVLNVLIVTMTALAALADPVEEEDTITTMSGFSSVHVWSSLSHPGAGPYQATPMMGNVNVPFQCQHEADATRVSPLTGEVSWWVKMETFYSENAETPTQFTSVKAIPNYFFEWDNNEGGTKNTGGVVINDAGNISVICPGNWLAYGHTGLEDDTDPVAGVTTIREFATALAP